MQNHSFMRLRRISVLTIGLMVSLPLLQGRAADSCQAYLKNHSVEAHSATKSHYRVCGMSHMSSLQVTKNGGLGSIDTHGKFAAVVERDAGTVALVDLEKMKVVGRYEDDVQDSLDGDVAFSGDGEWVFYARQTSGFDEDGIHVLNVSDPTQPTLTQYEPGGGSYRVAYYKDDAGEWVILLDAIDGLVVYRFVRESGTLVSVFQDATPALKVGGPASAGISIVRNDPGTKKPLMYVTTGRTGLEVYDLSDPTTPEVVAAWDEVGLADVKVKSKRGKRIVYAATEYWFDKDLPPAVLVLDATNLERIKKVDERKLTVPAEDTWRAQGLVVRRNLFVAHSHAGLVEFDPSGRVVGVASLPGPVTEGAGYQATPYAMDVAKYRGHLLISDAATGRLSRVFRFERFFRPGG